MTYLAAIAANVASVRARIAEAALRVGRAPADVVLVAITKSVAPPAVRALAGAGVTDIGENRSSELAAKQRALGTVGQAAPWGSSVVRGALRWHFVGHLQSNKAKAVVGEVALVHSVDSEHLLAAIDARARRLGVVQNVLVEVNLSGETSKHGFDAAGGECLCRAAADYPNVQVRGLMTMAPLVEPEACRPVFAAARRLFDHLRQADYPGVVMDTLSMGMSNDFEVAVEEGATCVRVGTALFASRDRG